MPRQNRVQSIKVPLSIDPALDRVLEDLAIRGILGKNKAEVARAILWAWVWDNEEKLERQGVSLAAKRVNMTRKGGKS